MRIDFDRLVQLRGIYAHRGPRDGRGGVMPDGKWGAPVRHRLDAVLYDADAAMRLGKDDHARWRHGMGLDEPEPARWTDDCPARGAGLSHAHWNRCAGTHPGSGAKHERTQCCHCGAKLK